MKTKTPEGATNRTNFMCLDLGTALKKTAYGKKFRRGSNGLVGMPNMPTSITLRSGRSRLNSRGEASQTFGK